MKTTTTTICIPQPSRKISTHLHCQNVEVGTLRQYYPRKLLGPLKSGMGRGLRPSVASLVERTPAARPLLSIGRAPGSTSGSASRGGWAAENVILLPRDFGSSYLFAYNDPNSGPTLFFALTICQSSPLSYHPTGFRNPFRGDISSGQYGSIIRASCEVL